MYSQKSDNQELAAFLPVSMEGWRTSLPDQIFDQQNIYEYLNGGAELYLSYDFHSLMNRTYTRDGQPAIIVDIFDMGSSSDAFGVFSHSRETLRAEYGQGSEYYEGFMLFWRDRYLVSIVASPETDASRGAVFALAADISHRIGKDGPLPSILECLPGEGLNKSSIRYFHNYIWMNSHYFIADENIFGIEHDTEAVLATYGKAPHRQVLLLLEYPGVPQATEAEHNFKQRYLPDLESGDIMRLEDNTWAGFRRRNKTLVVVLNAPEKELLLRLLDQTVLKD